MPSLIGLFHEPPVLPAAPSSPAPTDEAAREALRDSMRRDFNALLRRAAPVYEKLAPQDRKAFLPTWSSLQERMDRAHHAGDWVAFQTAFGEARMLLGEASSAIIGKVENYSNRRIYRELSPRRTCSIPR